LPFLPNYYTEIYKLIIERLKKPTFPLPSWEGTKGRGRIFAVCKFLYTILILLCLVLTYYFHFILHKEVVFSHFFYIPIALAGFWLGRWGVWVAIFLAAILMASHLLSGTGIPVMENVLRSVMFVGYWMRHL